MTDRVTLCLNVHETLSERHAPKSVDYKYFTPLQSLKL